MDEDLLAWVIGRAVPARDRRPARLRRFRRLTRHGATYPVLVPAAGSAVDGVLVSGLRPPEVARLSRFEGAEYRIAAVVVGLADGRQVPARAFMAKPWVKASRAGWSLEAWRRRSRPRFLAEARGRRPA